MKTRIKLCFAMAVCFIAANLYSLSDGAFNMTGAPGEGDCTGCHSGKLSNSDPMGAIQILIDSSNGFYEPGKTYPVKVKLNYKGKNRFGFALTTRKKLQFAHVGTFLTSPNSEVFNRFEYVAHSKASINMADEKTWSFNWQAPDSGNADINFYAAGVVANADNDNTGDIVYKTQVTLKSKASSAIDELALRSNVISVYPIPAQDIIWLKNIQTNKIEEAELIGIKGNLIKKYGKQDFTEDGQNAKLILGSEIPVGTYILCVKQQTKVSYAKLLLK